MSPNTNHKFENEISIRNNLKKIPITWKMHIFEKNKIIFDLKSQFFIQIGHFPIQIKIRNQSFSQNQLGLAISQKLKILWPNRLWIPVKEYKKVFIWAKRVTYKVDFIHTILPTWLILDQKHQMPKSRQIFYGASEQRSYIKSSKITYYPKCFKNESNKINFSNYHLFKMSMKIWF